MPYIIVRFWGWVITDSHGDAQKCMVTTANNGHVRRCVVLGAAPVGAHALRAARLCPGDLLLCADGGWRHARREGLLPHALIGDGDSGGAGAGAGAGADIPEGVEIVRLPRDKDITDTHACVDYGLAKGCGVFLLLGCTGGPRLDHFLGNLGLLEYCAERGAPARLLDDDNLILLHTGGRLTLPEARGYRYLSLLTLDRCCESVTLEGLRFPLQGAALARARPMALSNEPLPGADTVAVTLAGRALVMLSERNE